MGGERGSATASAETTNRWTGSTAGPPLAMNGTGAARDSVLAMHGPDLARSTSYSPDQRAATGAGRATPGACAPRGVTLRCGTIGPIRGGRERCMVSAAIDAPSAAIVAESRARMLEQIVEEMRVALLDVTDDLLHLARRRAGGVLQRHRESRASGRGSRTWRMRRRRALPARAGRPRQAIGRACGRAAEARDDRRCGDDHRQRGRRLSTAFGVRDGRDRRIGVGGSRWRVVVARGFFPFAIS